MDHFLCTRGTSVKKKKKKKKKNREITALGMAYQDDPMHETMGADCLRIIGRPHSNLSVWVSITEILCDVLWLLSGCGIDPSVCHATNGPFIPSVTRTNGPSLPLSPEPVTTGRHKWSRTAMNMNYSDSQLLLWSTYCDSKTGIFMTVYWKYSLSKRLMKWHIEKVNNRLVSISEKAAITSSLLQWFYLHMIAAICP